MDEGDASFYAAGVTADVLALAEEAADDEWLAGDNHGHVEHIAYHEFAATHFLHAAETIRHGGQHHMAARLVIDGDTGVSRQVGRIEGTVVAVNLGVLARGAFAEQSPTAIAEIAGYGLERRFGGLHLRQEAEQTFEGVHADTFAGSRFDVKGQGIKL